MTDDVLARKVSTSILETESTSEEVKKFVLDCHVWPFYGVAVDLINIDVALEAVEGTGMKVMTVASYPLGGMYTSVKCGQIEYARSHGAHEMDACLNFFDFKSGRYDSVLRDIQMMKDACGDDLKLILIPQFAVLTNDEKIRACELMLEAGVPHLKTNTGYGYNTLVDDVTFIKRRYGDDMSVEVSGGIRTRADAEMVVNAGACVVHTSTPLQVAGISPAKSS